MAGVLKSGIKNIIFDLGDVIIPIDLRGPIRNFAVLSGLSEDEVESLWREHGLTLQYETGLIDDAGFRQHVRQLLKNDTWADEVIDTAWNTVLLDLPIERVQRIQELHGQYRLFLLSNTSAIHIAKVNKIFAELGQPVLEDLFERVYYSYEVKLAKPSPEIYQYVLNTSGLKAEETLFLDDNPHNIRAAAELGIQAVQVQPPLTILDYLRDESTNEDVPHSS
ncbi:putative hydrolase of the HAD superfamily [Larkinella arboricola]|uniref:Putative hydrolase of the HAD superfamily n=1 Tax=Larkinella arboricola TaxID=643671 RepID=A0A327X059_LARAB|nr:HAD family phosphatase [Larkinella arboricola]RAJ99840.1 putative hydrolase of the HAD superfamily [Larkinella arboricola]